MLDLETVILTRIHQQTGQNLNLEQALGKSWWVYDKFGLLARIGQPMRAPLRRLKGKYRVPINRINRIVSKQIIELLYDGFQKPVQDEDLLSLVPTEGITRHELALKLEITVKRLNYRLRKEQNNWNLIKTEDNIFKMDDFISEKPPLSQIIISILTRYPYLTIDQLEFLTGRDRSALAKPINSLHHDGRILRGVTRSEIPDELFCLMDQEPIRNLELGGFVLEARDALVEILALERDIVPRGSDYWFFKDGLPQAEFDLKKRDKSYTIKNLYRFLTTTSNLGDILREIRIWGKLHGLDIHIDQIEDELTQSYQLLNDFLKNRGYTLHNNSYVLSRYQETEHYQKIEGENDVLTWEITGRWLRNRQFMQYEGGTHEILYHLGQIDDVQSLSYRLGVKPDDLDYTNVAYIAGIDHRLGFVHVDFIEDIIRGWPKQANITFLDRKILSLLEIPKQTLEIVLALGDSPVTIKQRMRYLERTRVIRKKVGSSLEFDHCYWMRFHDDLPPVNKLVSGKRAMASVGIFLVKILDSNPPLTKPQLSRYLGLTITELEPLLTAFIKKNKIIEGYFREYFTDIQYTLPEILDTIEDQEIDEEITSDRVDVLPISDPYAIFHLIEMIINNPDLQMTTRYHEKAEQWMILWDGIPAGYIIKQFTNQVLLDYELHIKVADNMLTSPVLAGAIQKMVTLFRVWYGDEGKISRINDILASDDKWKHIHFLIESIGVEMD